MALNAGAIRFNTDLSQMEIWDGNQWTGIIGESPHLHTGGTRGLGAGGQPYTDTIEYWNISSTGNAIDFGDCTIARYGRGSTTDCIRGVFAGGAGPALTNVMDYVNISTGGDAVDFGDRTIAVDRVTGLSNGHGGL